MLGVALGRQAGGEFRRGLHGGHDVVVHPRTHFNIGDASSVEGVEESKALLQGDRSVLIEGLEAVAQGDITDFYVGHGMNSPLGEAAHDLPFAEVDNITLAPT